MRIRAHGKGWALLCILAALMALAAFTAFRVTNRIMTDSFRELMHITADVHGFYSVIGYNEEMTAEIHHRMASQLDDELAGEKFRGRWGMSEDAYERFCEHYSEYRAFEISIEMANESDSYLHNIEIGCETPDSFVEREGFLFCDGPKLPEHTSFKSDTEAYVLIRVPPGADDGYLNEVEDTLRLYCYSQPTGYHDYPPMKIRLFRK